MFKNKFSIFSIKYNYLADRSQFLFSTYNAIPHVQNYALFKSINVYSDINPLPIIKFWYLFLICKQDPFVLWPTKLGRQYNGIKTKTKSFVIDSQKPQTILYYLEYMKKKIMPFVDEDYQSISRLNERCQSIKLRKCTTPEELHSLVLRTNIAIDNLKLIYTLQLFAKKEVLITNTQLFYEMLKLPIDMLLYRFKK